jgi:hypothetical protein
MAGSTSTAMRSLCGGFLLVQPSGAAEEPPEWKVRGYNPRGRVNALAVFKIANGSRSIWAVTCTLACLPTK